MCNKLLSNKAWVQQQHMRLYNNKISSMHWFVTLLFPEKITIIFFCEWVALIDLSLRTIMEVAEKTCTNRFFISFFKFIYTAPLMFKASNSCWKFLQQHAKAVLQLRGELDIMVPKVSVSTMQHQVVTIITSWFHSHFCELLLQKSPEE